MNSFLTRWLYGLDISDQSYKASTSVNNDSTEIVIVQNVVPTVGNMYGIGQVLLIVNGQGLNKLSSHHLPMLCYDFLSLSCDKETIGWPKYSNEVIL